MWVVVVAASTSHYESTELDMVYSENALVITSHQCTTEAAVRTSHASSTDTWMSQRKGTTLTSHRNCTQASTTALGS